MEKLIDKMAKGYTPSKQELIMLLNNRNANLDAYAFEKAAALSKETFGNGIYTRGLIELTNYCRNDCYYCGIRKSNTKVHRYRLDKETVMACCSTGYKLGFRTFVLQGGEDPYYNINRLIEIVSSIRTSYPDCAITLSLGEKEKEDYQKLFDAGANRYLLRHETANETHYGSLHPNNLTLKKRLQCLENLKAIGFQVGTGFMVGSPGQSYENLVEDLLYISKLKPHMIGIGPFIPQADTPFGNKPQGTLELTLLLLAILRLMNPKALIPSTTALGTIHPQGREKGILAGANVVMPNLSPISVRKDYALYDNKICMDEEAAESRHALSQRMKKIGYELNDARGDFNQ